MNLYGESTGTLRARVTTGRGAFPVEGATVYIRSYDDGGLLYTLRTDEDGMTDTVSLSAPDRETSLSPGSAVLPYAEYIITVTKDGYNTTENIGLPIFAGVNSVQTVDLIPLTRAESVSGREGVVTYYENGSYGRLSGDVTVDSEEVAE